MCRGRGRDGNETTNPEGAARSGTEDLDHPFGVLEGETGPWRSEKRPKSVPEGRER